MLTSKTHCKLFQQKSEFVLISEKRKPHVFVKLWIYAVLRQSIAKYFRLFALISEKTIQNFSSKKLNAEFYCEIHFRWKPWWNFDKICCSFKWNQTREIFVKLRCLKQETYKESRLCRAALAPRSTICNSTWQDSLMKSVIFAFVSWESSWSFVLRVIRAWNKDRFNYKAIILTVWLYGGSL